MVPHSMTLTWSRQEKRWELVSKTSKGCRRQSTEEASLATCELRTLTHNNRLSCSYSRMASHPRPRCSDLGVGHRSTIHNLKSAKTETKDHHRFASQITKSQCRFAHVPGSEKEWMISKSLKTVHHLERPNRNLMNSISSIRSLARSHQHLKVVSLHVIPTTKQAGLALRQLITISHAWARISRCAYWQRRRLMSHHQRQASHEPN